MGADQHTHHERVAAARDALIRQNVAALLSLVDQLRLIKAVLDAQQIHFSARMIDQVSGIQYNTIRRDEAAARFFQENSAGLQRRHRHQADAIKAHENSGKNALASYSSEHLIKLIQSLEQQLQELKVLLSQEQVAHKETTTQLAQTRAALVGRRSEIENLRKQVQEINQYRSKCQVMEEFLAQYLPKQDK